MSRSTYKVLDTVAELVVYVRCQTLNLASRARFLSWPVTFLVIDVIILRFQDKTKPVTRDILCVVLRSKDDAWQTHGR